MRKFLLATMAILWLLTGLGGRLVAQENIAVWKFPATGGATTSINADCVSDLIQSSDCELTVLTEDWSVIATDLNNANTVLCDDGSGTDQTKGLRLVNTNGNYETASIVFRISTAPYRSIQLSYDHRIAAGSLGGYATETWSYSINNGSSYTDMTPIEGGTTSYATESVDFSSISALNGVSSVLFKLTVSAPNASNAATIIDNVVFTGTPMTCVTPVNLAAVADDAPTEAIVTWDPAGTNEEFYTLIYYTGSLNTTALNSLAAGSSSNVIANVTSPYTLTELNANTDYYVYVRANCGGDDNSLWASTTVRTPAVCTITELTSSDVAGSTASLSWTTGADNTMIRVFTAAKDNPWGTTSGLVVDETVSGTSYDLTGLSFSTTYYVYAKAVCSTNNMSETVNTSFTTNYADNIRVLTVNDGTTTSSYVPFYGLWIDDYTRSEMIYPASQLSDMIDGDIVNISFYKNSTNTNSWGSASFKVYMKEVSATTLSSYIGMTDATVVYEGSVDASGGERLVTIDFTTPYTYTGGNLLIGIYETTAGSYSSANFYGVSVTNASASGYNSSSPASATFNSRSFLPKTTFTYTPGVPPTCPKPTDLVAGSLTATSATVTWLAGGEETAWTLKYGPVGFDVETAGTEVSIETTPSYDITGLTANTSYDVYVKAVCSDTDESDWKKISFRTTCVAITEFPWTEDFETYATGDFNDPCWVNEHITGNGSYIFKINSSTQGGNATNKLQLPDMSSGTQTKLVFPEMTLSSDKSYVFALDVYRNNYSTFDSEEGIRIYASTNGEIEGATELAFIPRQYSASSSTVGTEEAVGWYTYQFDIPFTGTCYIVFRGESKYRTATYMDNLLVREASSAAEITAFSFAEDAEVAVINSEAATVTSVVSYSTESLNGLVPTIAVSENASIAPASGIAQDFTGPVTYTVTAEDGTTTKEWTVNVSKVATASSAKDILSFTFFGQSREADIDAENHTVTAYAAWDYDFANDITPTIVVSPQATISPESGVAQNFATPVTYMVTAEDESTQQWTVTIINDPNACVNPLASSFDISDLTSSTATVAWERRYTETSYNVKVSTTAMTDMTATADVYDGVVNDTVIALTGLAENTLYYVYVQSACGIETWTSKTFRTIITPATIPYSHAFEDATENEAWVLENGTQTNKWYIGSASSNGGNGLYVSNDDGQSNAYTISSSYASYVYAYRTIDMTVGDYVVSYDWKGTGESSYDYMRVFFVPSATVLTAGSANGINTTNVPNGWIALDGASKLNLQSSWQNKTVTVSVNTAGTYNLVFYWRNDTGGGSNPPASVDNISITKITCPVVADLEANNITTTSADITWTERGTATAWDVVFSAEELDEDQLAAATPEAVDVESYQATELTQNTPYYIYVRAHCSAEDQSEWVAMQFRTECGNNAIPYSQNFNDYTATTYSTAGIMPDCWRVNYSGTSQNYAPHVCNYSYYAPSSDNYLVMVAAQNETVGQYAYAIFPHVEGGYANRYVSFDKRISSASNGSLSLGYMNGNSFVSLTDVTVTTSGTSFSYVVPNTVPVEAALAFRLAATSTSYAYLGIDNVLVRETSSDNTLLSYSASTEQGNAICAVNNDAHTISVELRSGYVAGNGIRQIIVPNDANATVQQQIASDFVTPPNYIAWYRTTADTTLTYKVIAENGNEQIYTATVTIESCAAPSVLASEQTSATNVNCSWTPAEGTSAWNFYCSTTQLTTAELNALTASDYTVVNVSNTSYTVTGETTYFWYVRTDCSGSYSAWQESSFTTWENCVAPTNVTTTVINDNNIVVSWDVQDNLPLAETNISDNFERGTIAEGPFSYSNDATYPWQIVDYDGTSCIKSSNGGVNSSQSTISMTYTAAADVTLSFKHWVMGEGTTYIYDYLIFTLDGVATNYSGTINENTGWSTATHNLSAGTHTMTWSYRKDGSTHNTGDCAYIDDITIYGSVPGGNSSVVLYKNDAELATVPATQTSYTDEGLEAGNYCYKVKTICREGSESDFSTPVCQNINACMTVTNMSATNVTPYSATINWTRGDAETAWNLMVNGGAAVALTETSEGVTVNENVITYALSGLEPMTDYTVTVQSDCGGSLSQSMTSVDFTTERVPATLPYVCDFEDAVENNSWVLDNGTQPNKWYIGTVANNGGANGLYISNDGGTTNAYTNSSASYVYAYRTINVENTTDYAVSYNWKAYGESENYDYIRAWLVPSSVALTPGQMPNGATSLYYLHNLTPDGWISLDGGSSQNMVSSWQSQNVTISIPAGSYNLVFFWGNDGSGGTNPPAAIDNVSIIEVTCPTVADLAADPDDITNNSAVITWVERGPATNWEIIVSETEVTNFASATAVPVTEPSYSATGLDAETLYHVYVRANCGTDDNSEWVSSTFSTVASCPEPDGLETSDVSATSATITWNGYFATNWTLEYRIGTTGTWTPVADLTATTYTLTTTANTTYNVRVKAVCGVDEASDYSEILSFTTPCEALTVDEDNPYTEGFESTTTYEIPSCWERIASYNSGSYEYPYVGSSSSSAHTDSKYLYMYVPSSTSANENIVALPPMNDINTLQISMWARYSTAPQSFEVGYIRNGVFTSVNTIALTSTYSKYTVYMSEAPADAQSIAIRAYHGTSYAYVYIDDINVSVIPSCIEPANVIASNIATTTASISWTDVNPATAWQYQINGGEIVDVNAQPVELTDLAANTAYTVNVRTVCGTDEYSAWSNVTFVTACDIISALPWSENFNSLSSGIPNCWDNTEGTTTSDSYKWNFYSTGHDGAGLRFNSYINSSGLTNMLKTPIFDLSAYDDAILKFWYKNPAGGDFSVYVSTDGGTTYTQNTLATGLTGTSNWTEMTYDISQYIGSNVVVVFKGTSNYGYDDAYIYLDDVSIHEPSSDAEIVAFSFAEEVEPAVINSTDATVTSVVSYSTESLNGLVPTISISNFATISPESGVAQDFTNPVVYTVTAEDGTTKAWTVNVSKMANASSEKDIISFTFNGQIGESVIDATAHTVTAIANINVDLESPITPAIVVSPMATISPASGVAQTFSSPVVYTVTAEDESTQDWTVTITQDLSTIASLPYSCDFEDASENDNWILENGTQANKWYIGTAANNGGANGLYITSDNGVSNTYNTNSESYSYAYRPINVEEAGHYDISFDWKSNGEEYYDFLRAFVVPVAESQDLVAGNSSIPTSWIDIAEPSGELSAETTWQHSEKPVSLEVGRYNIVFYWENDYSDGAQAPAVIDNLSIERSTFTITASAEGFGSIEPSGEVSVADGATQVFTMTPIAGFALSSLMVDGVDRLSQVVNDTYTFENVGADHTIVATFDAEHIINATAGNGGSISPAGQVRVGNGGNMTFTVTADAGYVISSVLVDNDEQIGDDDILTTFSHTFSNVTDDHTIAATFVTAPSHVITATTSEGGSVSPNGTVTVPYNGSQAFEFTANEGYRLSRVFVDGSSDVTTSVVNNVYTFNNVVADHTINGVFVANSYNLTIHYVYADNTAAAPDHTETLAFGTEYSVVSPVIDGYTASQETVAGTMPAQDVEVTVTYNADNYNLTIHYVYADNTTAAPDHTEAVAFGATYSVESPVIDGYTADQLTVAGTMPAQDVEVTVTYTANAPETYTLTIHYVYADNTTAAPDYTETLAEGAAYSVASPVIDGYTANQTTVAGTMPAHDLVVTVIYTANAPETYTLTIHYVYAETNATAAPDHTETLAEGANYSVASPVIAGYTADQQTVAGTMPAQNVEITVRYTANQVDTYTLTIHYVYAADNSTAAADHVETLAEGAAYSVASPVIAGYTADQTTVTGTMPAQDVEVTVRYTANSSTNYTIIATAGDNGTITPSDIVYVPEGANQTFRITPNNGYRIATVIVDGVNAIDDIVDYQYTFYNVTANHTIDVTFTFNDAIDEYTAGSMSVYPNPNNGMFSIDFSNINGDATYQLIDARGALVETREINVMDGDTMTFNHNLRPGAYFVRIITTDKVYVEQIVVE